MDNNQGNSKDSGSSNPRSKLSNKKHNRISPIRSPTAPLGASTDEKPLEETPKKAESSSETSTNLSVPQSSDPPKQTTPCDETLKLELSPTPKRKTPVKTPSKIPVSSRDSSFSKDSYKNLKSPGTPLTSPETSSLKSPGTSSLKSPGTPSRIPVLKPATPVEKISAQIISPGDSKKSLPSGKPNTPTAAKSPIGKTYLHPIESASRKTLVMPPKKYEAPQKPARAQPIPVGGGAVKRSTPSKDETVETPPKKKHSFGLGKLLPSIDRKKGKSPERESKLQVRARTSKAPEAPATKASAKESMLKRLSTKIMPSNKSPKAASKNAQVPEVAKSSKTSMQKGTFRAGDTTKKSSTVVTSKTPEKSSNTKATILKAEDSKGPKTSSSSLDAEKSEDSSKMEVDVVKTEDSAELESPDPKKSQESKIKIIIVKPDDLPELENSDSPTDPEKSEETSKMELKVIKPEDSQPKSSDSQMDPEEAEKPSQMKLDVPIIEEPKSSDSTVGPKEYIASSKTRRDAGMEDMPELESLDAPLYIIVQSEDSTKPKSTVDSEKSEESVKLEVAAKPKSSDSPTIPEKSVKLEDVAKLKSSDSPTIPEKSVKLEDVAKPKSSDSPTVPEKSEKSVKLEDAAKPKSADSPTIPENSVKLEDAAKPKSADSPTVPEKSVKLEEAAKPKSSDSPTLPEKSEKSVKLEDTPKPKSSDSSTVPEKSVRFVKLEDAVKPKIEDSPVVPEKSVKSVKLEDAAKPKSSDSPTIPEKSVKLKDAAKPKSSDFPMVPEKSEKSVKLEHIAKPKSAHSPTVPEKSVKLEDAAKPKSSDSPTIPEKSEKSVKLEDTPKPKSSDSLTVPEKSVRFVKLEDAVKPKIADSPVVLEKSVKSVKLEDAAKPKSSDSPTIPEKSVKLEDAAKPKSSDSATIPEKSVKLEDVAKPKSSDSPTVSEKSEKSMKLEDVAKPKSSDSPTVPEKSEKSVKLEDAAKPKSSDSPTVPEKSAESPKLKTGIPKTEDLAELRSSDPNQELEIHEEHFGSGKYSDDSDSSDSSSASEEQSTARGVAISPKVRKVEGSKAAEKMSKMKKKTTVKASESDKTPTNSDTEDVSKTPAEEVDPREAPTTSKDIVKKEEPTVTPSSPKRVLTLSLDGIFGTLKIPGKISSESSKARDEVSKPTDLQIPKDAETDDSDEFDLEMITAAEASMSLDEETFEESVIDTSTSDSGTLQPSPSLHLDDSDDSDDLAASFCIVESESEPETDLMDHQDPVLTEIANGPSLLNSAVNAVFSFFTSSASTSDPEKPKKKPITSTDILKLAEESSSSTMELSVERREDLTECRPLSPPPKPANVVVDNKEDSTTTTEPDQSEYLRPLQEVCMSGEASGGNQVVDRIGGLLAQMYREEDPQEPPNQPAGLILPKKIQINTVVTPRKPKNPKTQEYPLHLDPDGRQYREELFQEFEQDLVSLWTIEPPENERTRRQLMGIPWEDQQTSLAPGPGSPPLDPAQEQPQPTISQSQPKPKRKPKKEPKTQVGPQQQKEVVEGRPKPTTKEEPKEEVGPQQQKEVVEGRPKPTPKEEVGPQQQKGVVEEKPKPTPKEEPKEQVGSQQQKEEVEGKPKPKPTPEEEPKEQVGPQQQKGVVKGKAKQAPKQQKGVAKKLQQIPEEDAEEESDPEDEEGEYVDDDVLPIPADVDSYAGTAEEEEQPQPEAEPKRKKVKFQVLAKETREEAKRRLQKKPRKRTEAIKPGRVKVEIPRRDPSDSSDPAKHYKYGDIGKFPKEIAEIYSYAEIVTLRGYRQVFEEKLTRHNFTTGWNLLTEKEQYRFFTILLKELTADQEATIESAAVSILYIVQGAWADCSSESEVLQNVRKNVFALLRLGPVKLLTGLLKHHNIILCRERELTPKHSTIITAILSIFCTLAETVRHEKYSNPNGVYKDAVTAFCSEILNTFTISTLFKLVRRFGDCAGTSVHFPIKKTLLLLHKLILLNLGGFAELKIMKRKKRQDFGLPADHDDPDDNFGNDQEFRGVFKRPKVYNHEMVEYVKEMSKWNPSPFRESIREGIEVVKNHLYKSVGEIQMVKDEMLEHRKFIYHEATERTPTEDLYMAIIPVFQQFVGGLAKVIAIIGCNKEDQKVYKVKENYPGVPPRLLETVRLIDVIRHEEIIMKSIAAILILLLKHFRLNHVYQFEFLLVVLNHFSVSELVTRYLTSNVPYYLRVKNEVPVLEFPTCVIGYHEITEVTIPIPKLSQVSERNLNTAINLMRVLLKMMKFRKHVTATSYVDECHLLATADLDNPTYKTYACKILKVLMKYTSEWWKFNSYIIKDVCTYARPRLIHDDFMAVNYQSFYIDEGTVVKDAMRFNERRYLSISTPAQTEHDCIGCILMKGNNWILPPCLVTMLRSSLNGTRLT